ncbi:MAG: threonine synthase [Conexivisphaerales archaeon]
MEKLSFVTKLVCSKCGKEYDPKEGKVMCDHKDLGRLDIFYDYEKVKEYLSKQSLIRRSRDTWRWKELMPSNEKYAVRLGEGGTPLIRATRLAEKYGLKELYIKDETRNPTGSFKDRSMSVSVAKAVELGVKVDTTASSGNAAAALAAFSAKAEIKTVAFVLSTVSASKIAQLKLYGASVIKVRGIEKGEDPTVKMMLASVEEMNWYPSPSFGPFNPYQVEGPKAISFELAENFDWEPYDWTIVPTGSSCLLAGVWKGVRDLKEVGLVNYYPRLVPVQPAGNSALVRAIKSGTKFEQIVPERHPQTIAAGLEDPYPWDGDAALEGVKRTGGTGEVATDEEIAQAVKDLAKYEGVFAEPSGAAGLGAINRMLNDRVIDKTDRVVILVTGSGFKDLAFAQAQYTEPLEIDADIVQLKQALKLEGINF